MKITQEKITTIKQLVQDKLNRRGGPTAQLLLQELIPILPDVIAGLEMVQAANRDYTFADVGILDPAAEEVKAEETILAKEAAPPPVIDPAKLDADIKEALTVSPGPSIADHIPPTTLEPPKETAPEAPPPPVAPPDAPPAERVPLDEAKIESLTERFSKADLVEFCKERTLEHKGSKVTLVRRLHDASFVFPE